MGRIAEAIDAILETVRMMPGVGQVPAEVPESMDDDYVVAYPDPGTWSPVAHLAAGKKLVYQARHSVLLAYSFQADDEASAIERSLDVLDQMAEAVLAGWSRNKFRKTVDELHQLVSEGYGWAGEPNTKRFAAALTVDFTILMAVEGGDRSRP